MWNLAPAFIGMDCLLGPLPCSLIFKMLCAQWAQKLASVTSEDAVGEYYFLWNSFLSFFPDESGSLTLIKIIYLFIYGWSGSYCGIWAFPSCGKQGLLFLVIYRLLSVVTSLVVEQGLRLRAQYPTSPHFSVLPSHHICVVFQRWGCHPCIRTTIINLWIFFFAHLNKIFFVV